MRGKVKKIRWEGKEYEKKRMEEKNLKKNKWKRKWGRYKKERKEMREKRKLKEKRNLINIMCGREERARLRNKWHEMTKKKEKRESGK